MLKKDSHYILPTARLSAESDRLSYDQGMFQYDDPAQAAGLKVTLSGETKTGIKWFSRNIRIGDRVDFETLRRLYADKTIMANFGYAIPLEDSEIKSTIDLFEQQAQAGFPYGGWLIEDSEKHSPLGFTFILTDPVPGVCRIAYMVLPEHQNQGIASSIMNTFVKIWAPKVRQVGLQKTEHPIQQKFRCFNNRELSKICVTASPGNPASWKAILRSGCIREQPSENAMMLDYSDASIDSYKKLEKSIAELYSAENDQKPLEPGILYPLIDHEGNEMTVFMHPEFKKLKFCFECGVS